MFVLLPRAETCTHCSGSAAFVAQKKLHRRARWSLLLTKVVLSTLSPHFVMLPVAKGAGPRCHAPRLVFHRGELVLRVLMLPQNSCLLLPDQGRTSFAPDNTDIRPLEVWVLIFLAENET
jgi:hypothetical protein